MTVPVLLAFPPDPAPEFVQRISACSPAVEVITCTYLEDPRLRSARGQQHLDDERRQLIPVLSLLFRLVVPEWLGIIILSALVAHTGWHWMLERGEQLAKFPFPKLDAAFVASAMRGLIAALILAGAVWLANGLLRRWIQAAGSSPSPSRRYGRRHPRS